MLKELFVSIIAVTTEETISDFFLGKKIDPVTVYPHLLKEETSGCVCEK
jgi:hypothetical protein